MVRTNENSEGLKMFRGCNQSKALHFETANHPLKYRCETAGKKYYLRKTLSLQEDLKNCSTSLSMSKDIKLQINVFVGLELKS